MVDWEANQAAMKSVPQSKRQWVTKFESGICGTGRMMKLWKQRVIDNCPRCGVPKETTTHIIKCQSVGAQTVWEKSMSELNKWLVENNTCPDLRRLLIHGLQKWRTGDERENGVTFDFDGVDDVVETQRQIGWRQLIGGCLSMKWAQVQDSYYKWLGIKRTGRRWVTALIVKLWGVSWDQWESRNAALHNTPIAEDMSGAVSLNRAIVRECRLGGEGLPHKVRQTFPEEVDKFLSKSLRERKCWLVLVRASRELMNDYRIQDEFTNPQSPLRKWVGL